MPIPSPGTYDQASQATLLTVKAKTDIIGASVALEAGGNLAAVKAKIDVAFNGYVYQQLLARRGNVVQGTWVWINDAGITEWVTDRKLDTAGCWGNSPAAAINDEYAYPVSLPAGAYSCEIVYAKNSVNGILSMLLDADVLGTIDTYAAAPSYNHITVLDFAVAANTAGNLRFLTATKNPASAGYYSRLQRATLWRRS